MINIAQFFPHLPVPVRKRTITIAIPDTKDKPGTEGQKNHYQINQSCFSPDPGEEIKNNQHGMKNEEKEVGGLIKKLHSEGFPRQYYLEKQRYRDSNPGLMAENHLS